MGFQQWPGFCRSISIRLAAILALLVAFAPACAADGWRKIVTPHFTVISDASDDRTRAWATEFELFRRGVEALLPLDPSRLEPVQIVLFAGDSGFRAFRPLEGGKPQPVTAVFLPLPSRPLIALSVAGARDDARTRVYGGAMAWYLSGFDRRVPDWLRYGLAEVFGTFNLRGASFEIGITQTEHVKRVRSARPTPFAEFAATQAETLKFRGAGLAETEKFHSQAWLTAHELLFAPDAPGLPALRRYLDDPGAGDSLAEFEATFGRTVAQMDAAVQAHLYRRYADPLRTPLDRAGVDAGFELKPATPAEVDLALGALLVGVGRPEEAGVYLWRAATALPSDPRPYEALGEMEIVAKHPTEAAGHYRDAFTRGSKNFYARYVVAAERIRDQLSGAAMSAPEESDVAEALDLLAQCLAHNPRFQPAYEALAQVLIFVDVQTRGAEMQALLREGLRRNPRHAELQLAAGFVAARAGRTDEARTWLQKARAAAEGNGRVERIARSLETKIAAPETKTEP